MHFAAKEMATPFILFRCGKDAMPERRSSCRSCLTHIKQSLQAEPLKNLSVTESRPVLPSHALKHLAEQNKSQIAVYRPRTNRFEERLMVNRVIECSAPLFKGFFTQSASIRCYSLIERTPRRKARGMIEKMAKGRLG